MEQPQTCTKCNVLPEDILMLACKHDICLNCAADRLSFQMKKKKPANSIVCEFCYERTPLDADSIAELEKLITTNRPTNSKLYVEPLKPVDSLPSKYDKYSRVTDEKPKLRGEFDRSKQYSSSLPTASNVVISSRKACNEHPQEEILYFCFDCKVECICPECVIHGKHKDHDVKTIRKSLPIIKAELDASLDKIDNSISNLMLRKNQIEKTIRAINEQSNNSKRQIQTAFDQIRTKIDAQEKEILHRCETTLNESIGELDKSTKALLRRIDELKSYSGAAGEYLKKDEITTLNFYAKKWREMQDQSKEGSIHVPNIALPSNEKIISAILDLGDQIDALGADRLGR